MIDYILIPEYFDCNNIYSKDLDNFFSNLKEEDYIDSNKIKLKYLRKFYKEDKYRAIKTIKELKLRGFEFKEENETSFLSTVFIPEEYNKFIYTDINNQKYKEINKYIFNFLDYVLIEDDRFFNGIPIKGFKNYNDSIEESVIEKEFLRYGYKIISLREYLNMMKIKDYKYYNCYDLIEELIYISNINKIPFEEITHISIFDIYDNDKYPNLDELLKQNNIYLLSDFITNFNAMESFFNKYKMNNLVIDILEYFNDYSSKLELEKNKNELLNKQIDTLDMEREELLSEIYQKSKIEDIFLDIKGFKSQLNKLNKYKIEYLNEYNIEIIKNDKFNKYICDFKEEIEKKIDYIFSSKFTLDENIYELIQYQSLYEIYKILNKLDCYFIIDDLNLLEKFKTLLIRDIHDKKYIDFDKNHRVNLYKFNEQINNNLDLNKFINKVILSNDIDARTLQICQDRYINDKTLEETGKRHDITRERVRQITSKIEKKILTLNIQEGLMLIIKFLFNEKIINYSDLEKMIKIEYKFIFEILKKDKAKNIKYYPLTNRIHLLDKEEFFDKKDIDKRIINIIKELDIFGNYDEIIDSIKILECEIGPINNNIIQNIFKKYKIRKVNDKYIRLKDIKTNADRIELYMKTIFQDDLDFSNEETTYKLNRDFLIYFDEKTNRNYRGWEALMIRVDEIILIKPRTYIHINNLNINMPEIDFVKARIDYYLEEKEFIFADKLYSDLKEEFSNLIIKSKHELYSLIKYFYIDDLNFATGNSLKFSKKGTLEKNNTEILYDLCNDYKKPITYEEIIDRTEWSKHRINMAISNSDNIIKFGTEKCTIPENLFEGNEKELFKNKVKTFFEDEFTSSKLILDSLIFDEDLSDFIDRNNLTDDTTALTSLIKYLDKNIEGHTVFLYTKNSPVKSIEDLIRFKFPDGFNRKDIIDLLEKYKFSNGSQNLLSNKLDSFIENKEYLPLNREEYIKYKNFTIYEDFIKKILEYSEEIYKKNNYIIPNNILNSIKMEIGNTKYGLNQYIITNILKENGYKRVKRFNEDYRYEIIVLVKNNSKYNNLNLLVYDLLRNDYEGEWHEVLIYDYLSEKGFYSVENIKTKKNLKEDIIFDLIEVDNSGRVKLKEVEN